MVMQFDFLLARQFAVQCGSQQIVRTMVDHDSAPEAGVFISCDRLCNAEGGKSFVSSATMALSRAKTRHFATRTAPTVIPSFSATSVGGSPLTLVSQKACQDRAVTSV